MSSSHNPSNNSSESAVDELTAQAQELGLYEDMPNPLLSLQHAPVLFLDVDGVLHPSDAHFAVDDVTVPPAALKAAGLFQHCDLLAELLAPYPDVQVVVHSSWRRSHDYASLRSLLGPLGPLLVDVTRPELDRELSILAFMRERRLRDEAVVILDDQPEIFNVLRPRVVVSDPRLGVSDVNVRLELMRALGACYPSSADVLAEVRARTEARRRESQGKHRPPSG